MNENLAVEERITDVYNLSHQTKKRAPAIMEAFE